MRQSCEFGLHQQPLLAQECRVLNNLVNRYDLDGIVDGISFFDEIKRRERNNRNLLIVVCGEPVTGKKTLIGEILSRYRTRRVIYMSWPAEILAATRRSPEIFGTLDDEKFNQISASFAERVEDLYQRSERTTIICKLPGITKPILRICRGSEIIQLAAQKDGLVAAISADEETRQTHIQFRRQIHEFTPPLAAEKVKELKNLLKNHNMKLPRGVDLNHAVRRLQMDGATEKAVNTVRNQVNTIIANLTREMILINSTGSAITQLDLENNPVLRTEMAQKYNTWLLSEYYGIHRQSRFAGHNPTLEGDITFRQTAMDQRNPYLQLTQDQ